MRSTLAVIIALTLTLTSTLTAAEPGKRGKLQVYSAIVEEPLPVATKFMSPGQFFNWAVQANNKALADAYARNDAVQVGKPEPRERRAIVSDSSSTIKRRFGGGVGYGGYGGNGGYAGYNSNGSGGGAGSAMYAGMYGGGNQNYVYNYGYGFNNPGNASQETNDQSSFTYDMIYRDPETWDGGAVMLVNPFCQPK
jgi:hypothetical protein